jgi:hypothetical protein
MHPALIRYATPPRFSFRDVAFGATFTGLVFAFVGLFRLVSRVI